MSKTLKVLKNLKGRPEKNMSLRFKRNYHIAIMLITFLAFLVIAMGNQPIIAYFAN